MPEKTSDELRAEIVAMQDEQGDNEQQDNQEDDQEEDVYDGFQQQDDEEQGEDQDQDDQEEDDESEETDKQDDKADDKEDEIELQNPLDAFGEVEDKVDDKEDDDEYGDISKEDAEIIDRRLDKQLAPYKEKIAKVEQMEREAQLTEFLSADGQIFKPYADQIKGLINDPRFSQLGFKKDQQIAMATAMAIGWKNLVKLGAKRERELSNKSRATRTGGRGSSSRSDRDTGGVPDVRRMTRDNFADLAQKVKTGKYKG